MDEKRIFWLDLIRVIAIFSVIVIHTSAPLVLSWRPISADSWLAGNFYDSVTRIAVPLFIMVSGALLLTNDVESYSSFFRRRFLRIALPWFFWGTVYVLLKVFIGGQMIGLRSGAIQILNGTVFYHFWFLIVIVGLYLATPVLKLLIASSKQVDLNYYLILWFLLTSLLPFIAKLTNVNFNIEFPVAVGYVGLFLLGYKLRNLGSSKTLFNFACVSFFVTTFLTFLGTYYFTARTGQLDETYYSYLSPNVIITALSAFIILKEVGRRLTAVLSDGLKQTIKLASQASFGIYFIHVLVLGFLFQGFFVPPLFKITTHPFVSIPLIAIGTFILSLVMILVLQKIPYLKKVVA